MEACGSKTFCLKNWPFKVITALITLVAFFNEAIIYGALLRKLYGRIESRLNKLFSIIWRDYFKRIIASITLVAFIVTSLPTDFAWAYSTNPPSPTPSASSAITIPESLGTIKDSWLPASSIPRRGQRSDNGLARGEYELPVVIHIQDAHCNYYAQAKIADIIDYLSKTYGITQVNLEGGKGEYDLSLFTYIDDINKRNTVSDHFVKEGVINGAEYLAANSPQKISLWGIEDSKLYIENLRAYRDSLSYKDDVDKSLKVLNHYLSNLKTRIYSRELLELDRKENAYKEKSAELKGYVAYLINLSRYHNIDTSDLDNIGILNKTISLEAGIDFKRSNLERDELVDKLTKMLSRIEVKELVEKAVEFKLGRIASAEFHSYLLNKSKELKIGLDEYKDLVLYMGYARLYCTTKFDRLFKELDLLEDRIREKLYQNAEQKELHKLSKNLAIIKNIFGITLTPDDYRYFKGHRDEFEMENYAKFVNREAPLRGLKFRCDEGVLSLNDYLEKIEKFYILSLKRDQAFISNMRLAQSSKLKAQREKSSLSANRAAILITGGFHSENLAELFKKNNISYVSIMPNFKEENGYECPYFKLLSGKKKVELAREVETVLNKSLAYCSPNTELADDVNRALRIGSLEVPSGAEVVTPPAEASALRTTATKDRPGGEKYLSRVEDAVNTTYNYIIAVIVVQIVVDGEDLDGFLHYDVSEQIAWLSEAFKKAMDAQGGRNNLSEINKRLYDAASILELMTNAERRELGKILNNYASTAVFREIVKDATPFAKTLRDKGGLDSRIVDQVMQEIKMLFDKTALAEDDRISLGELTSLLAKRLALIEAHKNQGRELHSEIINRKMLQEPSSEVLHRTSSMWEFLGVSLRAHISRTVYGVLFAIAGWVIEQIGVYIGSDVRDLVIPFGITCQVFGIIYAYMPLVLGIHEIGHAVAAGYFMGEEVIFITYPDGASVLVPQRSPGRNLLTALGGMATGIPKLLVLSAVVYMFFGLELTAGTILLFLFYEIAVSDWDDINEALGILKIMLHNRFNAPTTAPPSAPQGPAAAKPASDTPPTLDINDLLNGPNDIIALMIRFLERVITNGIKWVIYAVKKPAKETVAPVVVPPSDTRVASAAPEPAQPRSEPNEVSPARERSIKKIENPLAVNLLKYEDLLWGTMLVVFTLTLGAGPSLLNAPLIIKRAGIVLMSVVVIYLLANLLIRVILSRKLGIYHENLSLHIFDNNGNVFKYNGPVYEEHGYKKDGRHLFAGGKEISKEINELAKQHKLKNILIFSCNEGNGKIGQIDIPCIHSKSLTALNGVRWYVSVTNKGIMSGDKIYSENGWSLVLPSGEEIDLNEAWDRGLLGTDTTPPSGGPVMPGSIFGKTLWASLFFSPIFEEGLRTIFFGAGNWFAFFVFSLILIAAHINPWNWSQYKDMYKKAHGNKDPPLGDIILSLVIAPIAMTAGLALFAWLRPDARYYSLFFASTLLHIIGNIFILSWNTALPKGALMPASLLPDGKTATNLFSRRGFLGSLVTAFSAAAAYSVAGGLAKLTKADESPKPRVAAAGEDEYITRGRSLYDDVGPDRVRFVSRERMKEIAETEGGHKDGSLVAGITLNKGEKVYVAFPGLRDEEMDFDTFAEKILNNPKIDIRGRHRALSTLCHERLHVAAGPYKPDPFKTTNPLFTLFEHINKRWGKNDDWMYIGKPYIEYIIGEGVETEIRRKDGKIPADNIPAIRYKEIFDALRECPIYNETTLPYEETAAYILAALVMKGSILDLTPDEEARAFDEAQQYHQSDENLHAMVSAFLDSLSNKQYQKLLDYYEEELEINVKALRNSAALKDEAKKGPSPILPILGAAAWFGPGGGKELPKVEDAINLIHNSLIANIAVGMVSGRSFRRIMQLRLPQALMAQFETFRKATDDMGIGDKLSEMQRRTYYTGVVMELMTSAERKNLRRILDSYMRTAAFQKMVERVIPFTMSLKEAGVYDNRIVDHIVREADTVFDKGALAKNDKTSLEELTGLLAERIAFIEARKNHGQELNAQTPRGSWLNIISDPIHEMSHAVAYVIVNRGQGFKEILANWKNILHDIREGKFTLPRTMTYERGAFVALAGIKGPMLIAYIMLGLFAISLFFTGHFIIGTFGYGFETSYFKIAAPAISALVTGLISMAALRDIRYSIIYQFKEDSDFSMAEKALRGEYITSMRTQSAAGVGMQIIDLIGDKPTTPTVVSHGEQYEKEGPALEKGLEPFAQFIQSTQQRIFIVGGVPYELDYFLRRHPEATITNVDVTMSQLEIIKERFGNIPDAAGRLRLYRADASKLDRTVFPDASVDMTFAMGMTDAAFKSKPEERVVLSGMAVEETRLLAPGGILIHPMCIEEAAIYYAPLIKAGYLIPLGRPARTVDAYQRTSKPWPQEARPPAALREGTAAAKETVPDMPRMGDETKAKGPSPEKIEWKYVGGANVYDDLDEARRALLSAKEPYCFTAIREPLVKDLEALVKSGNLELGIIRADLSQTPDRMDFAWCLVKGEPERFVHPVSAPIDFRLHSHSKRRTWEIKKHRETYMYPGQTDQKLALAAGRIEYLLSNKGIYAYGKHIDRPILMPWTELRSVDRRLSRFNQYVLSRQRKLAAAPHGSAGEGETGTHPALFIDTREGMNNVVRELDKAEHDALNTALAALVWPEGREGEAPTVQPLNEGDARRLIGDELYNAVSERGPPQVYSIDPNALKSRLPEQYRYLADGLITHAGTGRGAKDGDLHINLFIPTPVCNTLLAMADKPECAADLDSWRSHEIKHLLDRDTNTTPDETETAAARRIHALTLAGVKKEDTTQGLIRAVKIYLSMYIHIPEGEIEKIQVKVVPDSEWHGPDGTKRDGTVILIKESKYKQYGPGLGKIPMNFLIMILLYYTLAYYLESEKSEREPRENAAELFKSTEDVIVKHGYHPPLNDLNIVKSIAECLKWKEPLLDLNGCKEAFERYSEKKPVNVWHLEASIIMLQEKEREMLAKWMKEKGVHDGYDFFDARMRGLTGQNDTFYYHDGFYKYFSVYGLWDDVYRLASQPENDFLGEYLKLQSEHGKKYSCQKEFVEMASSRHLVGHGFKNNAVEGFFGSPSEAYTLQDHWAMLNVAIEGFKKGEFGYFTLDFMGTNVDNPAYYGPYYLIVGEGRDSLKEGRYLFIIPSSNELSFFKATLAIAVKKGMISVETANEKLARVMTYEQALNQSKEIKNIIERKVSWQSGIVINNKQGATREPLPELSPPGRRVPGYAFEITPYAAPPLAAESSQTPSLPGAGPEQSRSPAAAPAPSAMPAPAQATPRKSPSVGEAASEQPDKFMDQVMANFKKMFEADDERITGRDGKKYWLKTERKISEDMVMVIHMYPDEVAYDVNSALQKGIARVSIKVIRDSGGGLVLWTSLYTSLEYKGNGSVSAIFRLLKDQVNEPAVLLSTIEEETTLRQLYAALPDKYRPVPASEINLDLAKDGIFGAYKDGFRFRSDVIGNAPLGKIFSGFGNEFQIDVNPFENEVIIAVKTDTETPAPAPSRGSAAGEGKAADEKRYAADTAWNSGEETLDMKMRSPISEFIEESIGSWAAGKEALKGLNIGSAGGQYSAKLEKMLPGCAILDIDRAPLALEAVRQGKFVRADAEALPAASSSVDFILSSFLLNYTDRDKAAREMLRVLKDGGRAVLVLHNPNSKLFTALHIDSEFYSYEEESRKLADLIRWLEKIKLLAEGKTRRAACGGLSVPETEFTKAVGSLSDIEHWLSMPEELAMRDTIRIGRMKDGIDVDIKFLRNRLISYVLWQTKQDLFINTEEIEGFFRGIGFEVIDARILGRAKGEDYAFGVVLEKGKGASASPAVAEPAEELAAQCRSSVGAKAEAPPAPELASGPSPTHIADLAKLNRIFESVIERCPGLSSKARDVWDRCKALTPVELHFILEQFPITAAAFEFTEVFVEVGNPEKYIAETLEGVSSNLEASIIAYTQAPRIAGTDIMVFNTGIETMTADTNISDGDMKKLNSAVEFIKNVSPQHYESFLRYTRAVEVSPEMKPNEGGGVQLRGWTRFNPRFAVELSAVILIHENSHNKYKTEHTLSKFINDLSYIVPKEHQSPVVPDKAGPSAYFFELHGYLDSIEFLDLILSHGACPPAHLDTLLKSRSDQLGHIEFLLKSFDFIISQGVVTPEGVADVADCRQRYEMYKAAVSSPSAASREGAAGAANIGALFAARPEMRRAFEEALRRLPDEDPEKVKEAFLYFANIYGSFTDKDKDKDMLGLTRTPEEPRYVFMPLPKGLQDIKMEADKIAATNFAKRSLSGLAQETVREILKANGFINVRAVFYDGTIEGLKEAIADTTDEKNPVDPKNGLAYIDKKALKGMKAQERESISVTLMKEKVPDGGGIFSVGGHIILALGVLDLVNNDRAEDSNYWQLVLGLIRKISDNEDKYKDITKEEFMRKVSKEELEIDLPPIEKKDINEQVKILTIAEKAVGTAM